MSFQATSLSRQASGVHGRIEVTANGLILEYSYINADKGDDRVWLANRVHKALTPIMTPIMNGTASDYKQDAVQQDLTQFCSGLWDAWVEGDVPTMVEGLEEPVAPSFILEPYVLDGGGTIVYGPPGRGKSYLILLMAVSIDAGVQSYWPIVGRRVLFINLERSPLSVRNRLTVVNRALGLNSRRPLLILNARGKSLNDVLPAARAVVAREGIDTVALDSLSRAGMGDLNDNQAANKSMDSLSSLCPTWITIGHSPKSRDDSVFGSQMFEAACDVSVRVLNEMKEDGTLGVGLQIGKENDIGKRPLQVWAMEFVETGLSRFRPASTGEFPEIDSRRKLTLRQEIVQYILDADEGLATPSMIAEALDRNRSLVSSTLQNAQYFVMVRQAGRERWYGVRGREQ